MRVCQTSHITNFLNYVRFQLCFHSPGRWIMRVKDYHWVSRVQGDTYSWYCCGLAFTTREMHRLTVAGLSLGMLWGAGQFMANSSRAGFCAQLAAASPCCSTPLLGRHLYRWWLHLFLLLPQLFELVDLTVFLFSWWPLKGYGSSYSGSVSIAKVSILLTLYQFMSCT